MTQVTPTIVVHGGAGNIPDELAEAFVAGCHRAVERGLAVLAQGGAAEDAVEAAIRYLEDDEAFDAGRGSFFNMDGVVELDAAMMEGATLQIGAVAGLHDIANPITLARHVMASPHVFIIGEGASRFAVECGMARCGAERLWTAREQAVWERYRRAAEVTAPVLGDTVGAVALDASGHLVAGVSTGGQPYKRPGRVGDVPCAGAGYYADDGVGAAVSTGDGESIIRVLMAKGALDRLAAGLAPEEAAAAAIADLAARVGGEGGIIMLDPQGRVGCTFNTRRMGRGWGRLGGEIYAAVEPDVR